MNCLGPGFWCSQLSQAPGSKTSVSAGSWSPSPGYPFRPMGTSTSGVNPQTLGLKCSPSMLKFDHRADAWLLAFTFPCPIFHVEYLGMVLHVYPCLSHMVPDFGFHS